MAEHQRRLDERRVFEALWSHDAIELDSLIQQRATPSAIRDWAEDRWNGTPNYQTTFKSCEQFVSFVEYMSASRILAQKKPNDLAGPSAKRQSASNSDPGGYPEKPGFRSLNTGLNT
jgi:hypothetical protein